MSDGELDLAEYDQWNALLREQMGVIQKVMNAKTDPTPEQVMTLAEKLSDSLASTVGVDSETLGKFALHCMMTLAYNVPQPLLRFPF